MLDVVVVTVLDVAFLDGSHVVGMFLSENLLVLNRLDGGVVVVLVDLSVNGFGHILVVGFGDVFVDDSWVDGLEGQVR